MASPPAMVFSSIIFIFFFLPCALAVTFFPGNRFRNATLLVVSLFSYAWGEKGAVLLLLFTIFMNYLFGLGFLALEGSRSPDASRSSRESLDGQSARRAALRKRLLAIGVCANVGILFFYKYFSWLVSEIALSTAFFAPGAGAETSFFGTIHTPVGISFFTFHALSYLVDIYRKSAPIQRNPLGLALYMAVFPKMPAGPIHQYHDAESQLQDRTVNAEAFIGGIERFIVGLAKKMLLATPLAAVADKVFAIPSSGLSTDLAWLGIVCYTLQIYYDFSGYTDMAIGLGRMFGFRFPENFAHPYMSRSIREFWRRWHISLSQWLRDYLYIPLGGNRCSQGRQYFNLVLVFFLCGLWHGASWNFVIWGLWHGFFLALERTRKIATMLDAAWRPLRHLYALLLVALGWVFFRCETLPQALYFFKALFACGAPANNEFFPALYVNNEVALCIALGALAAFPWWPETEGVTARFLKAVPAQGGGLSQSLFVARWILLGALFFLSCMALAGGTHNPFIYFQF